MMKAALRPGAARGQAAWRPRSFALGAMIVLMVAVPGSSAN